jgi:hypothetical protein
MLELQSFSAQNHKFSWRTSIEKLGFRTIDYGKDLGLESQSDWLAPYCWNNNIAVNLNGLTLVQTRLANVFNSKNVCKLLLYNPAGEFLKKMDLCCLN